MSPGRAEFDRAGLQLAGTGQGTRLRAADAPSTGSFCVLLRNDGGKFIDVSESAGIQVRTPDARRPMAKSLGRRAFDVDGDGLVDLAVANDTVPNFLFHNLGGRQFEEIGMTSGIAFDQPARPAGRWGSTGATSRTTARSAWPSATSPTR